KPSKLRREHKKWKKKGKKAIVICIFTFTRPLDGTALRLRLCTALISFSRQQSGLILRPPGAGGPATSSHFQGSLQMGDAQEVRNKPAEENPISLPSVKLETRDEMLSRHRLLLER
ncbi:hypothetical protein Ancab_021722, partial [Ancistrocladus abbreviatus]